MLPGVFGLNQWCIRGDNHLLARRADLHLCVHRDRIHRHGDVAVDCLAKSGPRKRDAVLTWSDGGHVIDAGVVRRGADGNPGLDVQDLDSDIRDDRVRWIRDGSLDTSVYVDSI